MRLDRLFRSIVPAGTEPVPENDEVTDPIDLEDQTVISRVGPLPPPEEEEDHTVTDAGEPQR